MTEQASTLSERAKIERFHERFAASTSRLLELWRNERELALAMDDSDEAAKETIKIGALEHANELCREAVNQPTLDAVVAAFSGRVEATKEGLQARVDEAKAAGDKAQEIGHRIELGIYEGPVGGFLYASLKGLSDDAEKYRVMPRE